MHDNDAAASAYCPTAHSIHEEEAAVLAYCPGKQSIQSEPDGLKYLLAGHGALASVGSRYTRHNTIITTDKMQHPGIIVASIVAPQSSSPPSSAISKADCRNTSIQPTLYIQPTKIPKITKPAIDSALY
jgi:hypothetical protein